MEHTAHVFNGYYDKWVFMSKYTSASLHYDPVNKIESSDDDSAGTYPLSIGTDISRGPAGVHLVSNYADKQYSFNIPEDETVVAGGKPSVYDISPNKGAVTQPAPNTFILGGENFDLLPSAPLLSVS